jgi:hypothetical protein
MLRVVRVGFATLALLTCRLRAILAVLVIAFSAGALVERCNAATITVNAPDAYGRTFVDVIGEIVAKDDETFEQKVAILHARVDKVIVTLSGPGGAVLPAINIAELIHKNGWATYVPSGTICASSCSIIWLAGTPRTIEGSPGVTIGFHAVFSEQTQAESGIGNAVVGSHLARWGLTDQAVECVTVTPPNKMGWLTGPDGRACGINWEVLTPGRDVPLSLWQLPMPSETASREAKREEVFFECVPTSVSKEEPDPVVRIALKAMLHEGDDTIDYFDAWHRTLKGKTYKRSEQYQRRHVYWQKPKLIWDGHWIKDQNVYMIGQLDLDDFTYNERVYQGAPGPQNIGEEATNSVCKEVKQLPDWDKSPTVASTVQASSPVQSTLDKRAECMSKAKVKQAFCAFGGYDPAYCLEYRLRVQQVCEQEQ